MASSKWIDAARCNIDNIPFYGRWDDLIYSCVDTPLENDALAFVKHQLALDVQCQTPSLLAKWLPSENASSRETRKMGTIVREYLGMSHKQYRKMLSVLRSRINIVEKLMSEGRFEDIEFDKIPSKAGLIYKNAFARRDIIAKQYEEFIKDKSTKVNADVLNPVDIAKQIFNTNEPTETERAAWDKYWSCLKDYYNGNEENGLAICDVSGSMIGLPMAAAVSLSAYIAERGHGPFANHFITFSANPKLVKFEGIDIADKFNRAIRADWGMNTNIEAVFKMLLKIAIDDNVATEDLPTRLYIFSDQEFNGCITQGPTLAGRWSYSSNRVNKIETLLEQIEREWAEAGYQLPKVIFWNLNSRNNNIPALGERFSYVSGFSMSMVETILSGGDGYTLMLKKLVESGRYDAVKI